MKDILKQQVETILVTEPETRNSDITLMIALWKRYYSFLLENDGIRVRFDSLYDLPREDNIKRHRATIQNKEMRLLPTNEGIFIERARQSKDWKKKLGYNGTSISTKNFDEILSVYYRDYIFPKQQTLI